MWVAVLMGGRSGEHDVSLVTGAAVGGAVERLGHQRFDLVFGRGGGARWSADGAEVSGTVAEGLLALSERAPAVAFIAMHGSDGEDGRVQGALEMLRIPYQGSGVAASAVALDKARTKQVYEAVGLPVASDLRLRPDERPDWDAVAERLGLPLVLKTADSGSSVGVEVIQTAAELAVRGPVLLARSEALVCESWLEGTELTCAVLDQPDGPPQALPLVEIVPRDGRFFDYETKYDPNAVDEICPARVSPELTAEVQQLALAAHRALRCRDYSRTDFKLDSAGRPRLLETNTLPGLTAASLLPKAALAAGLSFDALIAHLLALARTRGRGLSQP